MPTAGLEPANPFGHTPLERTRLPISPRRPAPLILAHQAPPPSGVWISVDREGRGGVAAYSQVMRFAKGALVTAHNAI